MYRLGQSLEDYLETIYLISKEKKVVRVTDIAQRLSVKKSSVVAALKKLKEKNLASQERYGYVELTEEGEKLAKRIYDRHRLLERFLHEILGVSKENAEKDACVMEHYLSRESIEKLKCFIEELEKSRPQVLKGELE